MDDVATFCFPGPTCRRRNVLGVTKDDKQQLYFVLKERENQHKYAHKGLTAPTPVAGSREEKGSSLG